jgi:steroid delta-isomerase-like uncharacterized protein
VGDVEIVRRITNECFLGGDVAVWDELVSDDFVDHDPLPGEGPTKEDGRRFTEMVIAAFSDRKAEFDEYLETTDGRVVESWLFTGKHTGEFAGLPPSGKAVQVRGVEIWKLADGKVVEHWGAVDMSDVFEKAGAG